MCYQNSIVGMIMTGTTNVKNPSVGIMFCPNELKMSPFHDIHSLQLNIKRDIISWDAFREHNTNMDVKET